MKNKEKRRFYLHGDSGVLPRELTKQISAMFMTNEDPYGISRKYTRLEIALIEKTFTATMELEAKRQKNEKAKKMWQEFKKRLKETKEVWFKKS